MDYLSVTMRHEPTEATRLLFLDRKNALIKDEIQHRGTVDHTPLYPREVVKRVLELGASAVILVHNHPSGDPTPSQSDIEMTRQLAAALGTINVALHDHVIVGRNREISLRKSNLL
jgi:DNA repair protein RadC